MESKDCKIKIVELTDGENADTVSDLPKCLLTDPDIDRGWAWLALGSSFTSMVLIGLNIPIVGIMYVHQLETFEKSPAITACIGSLMTASLNICGPVAGWIASRYSRRVCVIAGGFIGSVSLAVSSQSYNFWAVLVTNGFLAGFALGLCCAISYINIGCYFIRRRALASGIILMGCPVGVFIAPPIIQYLEYLYGWRGAILVIAGIQLNNCVMGALLKPSAIEKYHRLRKIEVGVSKKESSNNDRRLLTTLIRQSVYKNISSWFLAVTFMFTTCSITVVYLHLPRYTYTLGGTAADVQMLYLVLGLTGTASRALTGLGSGTVRNGVSLDKISLLLGSFSIVGTTLVVFPTLAHTQSYRLLCMFFIGFYYNVEPVLYVPVIVSTVGFSNLPDALGLILLSCGIGYLIGGPLAAAVVTATQHYDNAFYMAGGLNFLAVLSLTIMVLLKTDTAEKSRTTSRNYTITALKDIPAIKMDNEEEVKV